MAGLYLYCVRRKKPTSIKAIKTIGSGEVYTLPFEELEAVVSEVNLTEFGSEKIQKKAQEDLNWIKEKAQVHEYVIEQAMGPVRNGISNGVGKEIVPVIPMRFGTIFKSKKNLEEMISKHYEKFKESLESLSGKQEWGVKVYLNEKVFEKQLEEQSEDVLEKKKEIAALPKGIDFFAKKQVDEVIKKEKDRKLKKVLKEVFESLQKLAAGASQGKNLDKAITGREEPMVLNANFLIKEEEVGEFQREVDGLKTKYQGWGLIIQESGPWPAYNFIKI